MVKQMRYYLRPQQMNLELTQVCPLHCPQCYVAPGGRHMEREVALQQIREAAAFGVRHINLSGGETLCYPYLSDLIRECSRLDLISAVSLSGALAEKETLRGLILDGVTEIYVSLNGSTEEINRVSRDGYDLAIHTLQYLRELREELSFERYAINWVMHDSNADDFPNMLKLAEHYQASALVVLGLKPDSAGELKSFPSLAQMEQVARQIRSYKGAVEVDAESCFSPMRAILGRSLLGNQNMGIELGCGAGRDSFSVDIDGNLTPCRHILLPEKYGARYSASESDEVQRGGIENYWKNSPVLALLRSTEEHRKAPCRGCRYEHNCLPCADISDKLTGSLVDGFPGCPAAE